MNEPQVWTLIGVFAAVMFATVGSMSSLVTRVLRAELGMVNLKIDALDAKVDAKIDALDAKVGAKFDALDRDVQALARQVFPGQD